jgi:rhodanese-related sulfurtransferase
MSEPLSLHYATASTDTGHEGAGLDTSFALGHPERLIDFANREPKPWSIGHFHANAHSDVPEDLKVILYSPSGSPTVSARVAMGLKRIGINKVWVLDGGLKAWRKLGLPVSHSLERPEVVAKRYGIKLPARHPAGDTKDVIN